MNKLTSVFAAVAMLLSTGLAMAGVDLGDLPVETTVITKDSQGQQRFTRCNAAGWCLSSTNKSDVAPDRRPRSGKGQSVGVPVVDLAAAKVAMKVK